MAENNTKHGDQTDFSREDLEKKFADSKGLKFKHRSGDITFFTKRDSEDTGLVPASVKDMQSHV